MGLGVVALLLIVLVETVSAEVYFSLGNTEISGSGPRKSRSCTILLKPAQTLGVVSAPRLMLVTTGRSTLTFGLDRPSSYSSLTIVQHNTRRPFPASGNVTLEVFRDSQIAKALKSGQLFYITAQLSSTGEYVSSRFEDVGFDALLREIELNCPFDAESLMTDTSSRERAERDLALSTDDLALIRWALNKRYGGAASAPDAWFTLSELDRTYLKRYASENGLPISRYLTADCARTLILEGQLARNAALSQHSPSQASPPLSSPPEKTSSSWPESGRLVLVGPGKSNRDTAPSMAINQLERLASEFVIRYVSFENEEPERSLTLVATAYAPLVFHFGRWKTREDVLTEYTRFIKRWPSRRYTLKPGSLTVSCVVDQSQCVVDIILNGEASSSERNAKSIGVMSRHIVLNRDGNNFAIAAFEGKDLPRQPNPDRGFCLGPLCFGTSRDN